MPTVLSTTSTRTIVTRMTARESAVPARTAPQLIRRTSTILPHRATGAGDAPVLRWFGSPEATSVSSGGRRPGRSARVGQLVVGGPEGVPEEPPDVPPVSDEGHRGEGQVDEGDE